MAKHDSMNGLQPQVAVLPLGLVLPVLAFIAGLSGVEVAIFLVGTRE